MCYVRINGNYAQLYGKYGAGSEYAAGGSSAFEDEVVSLAKNDSLAHFGGGNNQRFLRPPINEHTRENTGERRVIRILAQNNIILILQY